MMTTPTPPSSLVVARFRTRDELRAALHPVGRGSELVLEGPTDPTLPMGSVVLVRIEVHGHPIVEVEAVTTWRRPVARRGLPAALGLRLDERSAARVYDLRPSSGRDEDVRDVVEWRSRKPKDR